MFVDLTTKLFDLWVHSSCSVPILKINNSANSSKSR